MTLDERQAKADDQHSPRPFGNLRLTNHTVWRNGVGLPAEYLRVWPVLPEGVAEKI